MNYPFEPLNPRREPPGSPSEVFDSRIHGDPAQPLIEVFAGDAVKLHVLVPFSEQSHVLTVEGHRWPLEPDCTGSTLLSAVQIGATEAITLELDQGAGGPRKAFPATTSTVTTGSPTVRRASGFIPTARGWTCCPWWSVR
jgi:hypothetical protein